MKPKQTKKKIRVMLVDDHSALREALRKVINLQPDLKVAAEASSGRAALQLLSRINPDVVLMDGSMPEMNGIETTRRLKRLQTKAKIIGLTLYGEPTYLEEMVTAGASGYLMKTGAPENVINAIRIVSKGGTYFDPAVPRRQQASVARSTSATEELTARELAVAKLLSNGLTNAEIAVSLDLKIPAVEAHRTAALKKLGLRSRAELVRVATERHWLDT
jgi:two-component system, NarL family, response regulator NreC